MAEFGNAAMQGFQTGFQSRGPSALGVFLDTLTDRMTKLQELRAKSQADVYTSQQSQLAQIPGKVQEAGLTEQAKAAVDPEKRLFAKLTGDVGADSGQGLPGGFQLSKISAGPFTFESPEAEGRMAAEKESQVRLEKLKDAVPLLQTFERRLNELPAPKGATARAIQAPGRFLATKTQADPKLAAFESFRTGMRSQIARILGEVGNLSETEQKYAINLLPSAYDTQDTRTKKFDNFYDFVSQRVVARTGMTKEQSLEMLRPGASTSSVESVKNRLRTKYGQ